MFRTALLLIFIFSLSAKVTQAQVSGCTDKAANNYNATATVNDGSCTYDPAALNPSLKFTQDAALNENSGMIFWNDQLWQHNDGGSAATIYAIDTASRNILRTITINGATNVDWEDMAQDDTYLYIGDFGNNSNGARIDLKIYKILKADISGSTGDVAVNASVISFTYADQPQPPTTVASNTTDFDCEAMIAYNNKLYLFTKQWTSQQTTVYELPNTSGSHTASKITTFNVSGLITGADVLPARRSIVLTGYTATYARFIYLLYDFTGTGFFSGNKRKVNLNSIQQTESVAFRNEEYAYIGSEKITSAFYNQDPRIETINLTSLLKDYHTLLPFKKLTLTASARDTDVHLNWQILPPEEYKSGSLERRLKSDTGFRQLLILPASAGNYIDPGILGTESIVNYRLRATDKMDRISYSPEVIVKAGRNPDMDFSYRNGKLYITRRKTDPAQAEIFLSDGRQIFTHPLKQAVEVLDLMGLPKGIHTCRVLQGEQRYTYRFMKD